MDCNDYISSEEIARLAVSHIQRYRSRLESGSSNVRKGECLVYLNLWRSIKDKGIMSDLTDEELREVRDAIEAGE